MPPGPGPITGAEQAQAEPEVGVVVHRVELQDLLELRPGGLDPLGAEVGPGQGLPDRALVGLDELGPSVGLAESHAAWSIYGRDGNGATGSAAPSFIRTVKVLL